MSNKLPLTIKDFSVEFRKPLFRNVNLDLHEQEFVTIMGENGSGKTTLIESIMGIKSACEGQALFWGQSFSKLNRETLGQKIGWVLSHREAYPPGLSIRLLFNALKPFYPTWDETLVARVSHDFNLDLDKILSHLSLGERSKVKLLRALAFRPRLLILDELTANLSEDSKKAILSVLIDLFTEMKMAALYISHSSEEALRLSDRIFSLTPNGLVARKEF